jgi:uncharacterized membrane protein
MSPLMKNVVDTAVAIALTMAVVFVIVVASSFLTARGGAWTGFNQWMALVKRPDIIGTMVLTALVTMAYVVWQKGKRPR